ncbi:YhdH/YhfP family quinone oxidoreductase [Botrimarina mediterranea]|uniref:Putative acrylyl-CoA reductase AcuI n=1 Tax=Botrimarina mediterranea TaxID=2528022 RepID=A0A518K3H0_9BACT|nr:YhdH/YhfP family quinone oxidoreductase [Botrimarina mediterranea]QDV72329.1 putative acrylyl-CoA reductase AcuI [Botrimarina mediterranea]
MIPTNDSFAAWVVREDAQGKAEGKSEFLSAEDLPAVDGPAVHIAVEYSSLNYKDALACRGHRGVVGQLPHVPGIDCAGTVVQSDSPELRPGDAVLVTGYDLGAARWGGYSGLVRAPVKWPVKLPPGFTPRDAMLFGTAGFTAAQCVMAIEERVAPDAGDVVVTGATGGVGVFAVALLAKLGYRVTAITGKPQHEGLLRKLGAAEVLGRDAVTDDSDKPMLTERWAAAVDTVGGAPLAMIVRSLRYRGVVAACGLVAGTELPLSVYPFLLRGVTLAGIDSAKCPREPRLEVWRRLMGPWRVELPEELVTTVTLSGLPEAVERILRGGVAGRTLVRPVGETL